MVDSTHNGGPPIEDEPTHAARRGRRDPWFKFYPADWLRDTRHLTLEQRGAYIDSIAIQMERGEPIPDDVSWLSHQLHISTRKARALVQQLVEAKMLLRKDGNLSNASCEREIAEREALRVNASHSAAVRERAKREPTLNQSPVNDEPELNRAPLKLENPELFNEINETPVEKKQADGTTRTGAHARLEREKEEEKKVSTPLPPKGGTPFECLKAFELYNALALRVGIPQAAKLTPDRQRKISARLKDYGPDGWDQALAHLERSAFLTGTNDRGWRATLDFLLQPASFSKLHDGGYGNGRHAAVAKPSPAKFKPHETDAEKHMRWLREGGLLEDHHHEH
jgi:uncharacterized protein YdaU (DUF1376 family)